MDTRRLTTILLALLIISAISYAQAPSTADGYLHLTQIETAFWDDDNPEDIVWFYSGDTLDGPVRSNDYIAIKMRPIFIGPTYTSQSEFIENAPNPYFEYEPQFSVPDFEFAFDMGEFRQNAIGQDMYFSDYYNGLYVKTRLEAQETGWYLTQWPYDLEYSDEEVRNTASLDYSNETIIFVEGELDIFGEEVTGNNTIVCSGQIRIIDNLMYDGTTVVDDQVILTDGTVSTLGLIASGNILIANTGANGRGNGLNTGSYDDHSNKHCVVTASIVSINSSFTYENKNFAPGMTRYDGVFWCDPEGDHPGEQDRRGSLFFLGSMAEHRRDYFSNSNCGRSGFDKHFRYDHRLEELTPPLFDIALGIGETSGNSATLPVTHQLEKPYPNPFNSSFNLNMLLAKRDQVKIRLVNVLGQEVFSQNFGWMDVGQQRFTINLFDNPAGLYFAQVSTSAGFSQTVKVVFVK